MRLTIKGIANIIARGIRSNYAPDHQRTELENMAEHFWALAMSRGMEAELAKDDQDPQANNDANVLNAIADELEQIMEAE